METEFDVSREVELFEEYSNSEELDAFIDEMAIKHCGDVYITGVK